MQINIEVPDLHKFQQAMQNFSRIVAPHLDRAIRLTVFQVEREAKMRTPVDTGRLRSSYQTRFGNLEGFVGPTAEYAIFVHEGTQYVEGRPFLAEGVEASTGQIEDFFHNELEQAFQEIARRTN